MPQIRLRVPSPVAKGEIVEIKTLITHDMESGQRRDAQGRAIARKILKRFVCTLNGREVISADWFPAVAANPYFVFHLRAAESGKLELAWTDDDGSVYTDTATLIVT